MFNYYLRQCDNLSVVFVIIVLKIKGSFMKISTIGFGIAGNFARHLEQAGESADFIGIETEEEGAPKGIFPTYVPGSDTFLGIYPFSTDTIQKPSDPIQMEPEIALLCDVTYAEGKITQLNPTHFGAYNDCSIRIEDCSIRIEGAPKISNKKNWGKNSKGVAPKLLPVDSFSKDGMMDNYALTSFIRRNGELHQYGENSPLTGYSYFHEKLTAWIVDKLNTQRDQGPLEDLPRLLKSADYPPQLLISIGATRYTPYGESHYLETGDTLFVIVYDQTRYPHEEIIKMAENDAFAKEGISLLIQSVV